MALDAAGSVYHYTLVSAYVPFEARATTTLKASLELFGLRLFNLPGELQLQLECPA